MVAIREDDRVGTGADRPGEADDRVGPGAHCRGRACVNGAVAHADRLQAPRIGPHVDEASVRVRRGGAVDVAEAPGGGATGGGPVQQVDLPQARLGVSVRATRHPEDHVGVVHVGRGRDVVHAGAGGTERPQEASAWNAGGKWRAVPAEAGCGGHAGGAAVQRVDLTVARRGVAQVVAAAVAPDEDDVGRRSADRLCADRLEPDRRRALEPCGILARRGGVYVIPSARPQKGARGRVHGIDVGGLPPRPRGDVGDVHLGARRGEGRRNNRGLRLDRSLRLIGEDLRGTRRAHAADYCVVRARDHDVVGVKAWRSHAERARGVAPRRAPRGPARGRRHDRRACEGVARRRGADAGGRVGVAREGLVVVGRAVGERAAPTARIVVGPGGEPRGVVLDH